MAQQIFIIYEQTIRLMANSTQRIRAQITKITIMFVQIVGALVDEIQIFAIQRMIP